MEMFREKDGTFSSSKFLSVVMGATFCVCALWIVCVRGEPMPDTPLQLAGLVAALQFKRVAQKMGDKTEETK